MVKAIQQQLWFNEIGNDLVARQLDEVADRLAEQGANLFRIAAYRKAAATLRELKTPVRQIFADEGISGLLKLPAVGPTIGRAIQRFLEIGKIPRLEQLRAVSASERIFTTVAEIGPKLATEIHDELGIETLADLEAAAWDGRLARVPGMGPKRVQAVREALAGRFRHSRQRISPRKTGPLPHADEPGVAVLLDVDEEYRHLVELDRLPRIAPRRFNPEGKAWLPILNTQRGSERYTAMFSNTARAYELGTTRDWVVIFRDRGFPGDRFQDQGAVRRQWTAITSKLGHLSGKRVVRGRERECAEYYAEKSTTQRSST